MSFSEPFIRRPVATSLLAIALILAGAAAYTQLPVAPLPRVDFPTISVQAALPGASPETMASSVATPLERRLGRIAGLSEMTSASAIGSTSITLQFDLDRNVDAAARDVQAAINAAGGDLPQNLPQLPIIKKVNPADSPILILGLTSKTLPLGQVYDQANTVFAQKISQVPGVGQVFVGGGQQPAVRIKVDPERLAGLGLGLEDLRSLLGRATVDQPQGSLAGASQTWILAANDQLFDAAAFRKLVIGSSAGGVVRLGDVATVQDDVENYRVAGWSDHDRAVIVVIRRQPGANILEVIDRIEALLPSLAASISPAIDVAISMDRALTIRASVHDVQTALIIAVLLVVLVVFLFLRDPRATAIPSVAVPLSLLGTFGFMYLLHYSLDNLSLMALTISTGFVVDDAIVVTENVARFVEVGEPAMAAALKGAKQIGFTIVSITGSLLAVFLPILLMGGIVGRIFREFAVTLSIAVAVSATVSLTLTPMMCSRFLRHTAAHGRLYRASERAFEALLHAYDVSLRFVLRHQPLTLAITLGTLALTIFQLATIPKGLFPQQDTGAVMGFSDAPQDISFPAMEAREKALNDAVLADPAVKHMVSFIGVFSGGSINTGMMFMELWPKARRKVSADEMINRLRPKLAKVEGIRLFLQSMQDVRVGGRLTRTQYQYTLEDGDLAELNRWAPRMLQALKKLPALKDVNTDQQTAGLELDLAVDRDTASKLGLSMADVDNAFYDAFGQRQVATTYTELNQYHVVLEVEHRLQASPDALDHVYVRTPGGGQVPLSALARFTASATSLSVNHQGQFPAITLSFNLAPGYALSQAVDAIHEVEDGLGMPPSVHGSFQGTAQAFQGSLKTEPWLILAALLAVYIVLGILYESLIHPLTILSTLPSAGVGALLALRIFRQDFSIIALIGIILLIGIVKKNAILMIDFALEVQREQKLPPLRAIHDAALLRFRPILMTTLAAFFGGLPLAVGTGEGSELRQPLGITIVGGLLFSQALTLFTTPVIYLYMGRLGHAIRRRLGREPAEHPAVA
ncbi:MAG: multidrug efflux RND transporter permease subunit [Myxococcales bacterium]